MGQGELTEIARRVFTPGMGASPGNVGGRT